MSFHYLIDYTTGEKLGETADKDKNAPADMKGREWVDFEERPRGAWDAKNRVVVAGPEKTKCIEAIRFTEAFSTDEFKNLLRAAKVNENVEEFLERIRLAGEVTVNLELQAGLNYLETQSVIEPGRAASMWSEFNA